MDKIGRGIKGMGHRKKQTLLLILIPILMVGIFIFLSIHYLLDPNMGRVLLQKALTTTLGSEVSIGKARIYWWKGIGVTFEDLKIEDPSQTYDLLKVHRLILGLKLFPLLKGELKWKRVILERPSLRLIRGKRGQVNILPERDLNDGEMKEIQKKILNVIASFSGGALTIHHGEVSFTDESLDGAPIKTEISSFNLDLPKISEGEPFSFKVSGKIVHSKRESPFSIEGRIQSLLEDLDLLKGMAEVKVKVKDLDTLHFWPYLKSLVPMRAISGRLDLEAYYQGNFQGTFRSTAKIKLRDLLFDYPQVFFSVIKSPWINIDVKTHYDSKNLNIQQLSIELPELQVQARGRIYEIGTEKMGIEAEAFTNPFDVSEGKKFIPFRIITPDVSDALFQSEGKGAFQILSVKLAGKISEIDQCDRPENAHVLSIQARLNGVQLKLPWNLPAFEDLKGQLLFEKGHLYLNGVEGKIFHSTLKKVRGVFYDLLHVPTLEVDCGGEFDLKDLPPFIKIEGLLERSGQVLSSLEILSGKAQYSLWMKGVLRSPLQFQHQGGYTLSKVRFKYAHMPFPILIEKGKLQLSHKEFQWSETEMELGQTSLESSGIWRYSEKEPLFEIVTKGTGDLKSLSPLFQSPLIPEGIRSKAKGFEVLSGSVRFSFSGKKGSGTSHFSYNGKIFPREVSILRKESALPIRINEGEISFSNLGMVFSKLGIQLKNTSLILDGHFQEGNVNLLTKGYVDLRELFNVLRSFPSSEVIPLPMEGIQEIGGRAEVQLKWLGKMGKDIFPLSEGEIRLKEISLQHQQIPLSLSLMEGTLLVTPEQIRWDQWKGKVGDSPFVSSGIIDRENSSLSFKKVGGVPDLTPWGRRISFHFHSTQLDINPFLSKKKEIPPPMIEKVNSFLLHWWINGTVQIDQGKYHTFQFQTLKTEMRTINGTLFLRPIQFKSDGGDFWGEGWIKPTEKGIQFEVKPRVSNMGANSFLNILFSKNEEERMKITGRVSIDKAELRGQGEDFQKLKESLTGSLRFEIENGVIERFNILSKIFSLLNISQFFRGRLPDLKTKGLPYHQILANIHIKEGVASTNDFIVDSDAMRMTVFGRVDLGKNLIDVRIGVHPLITIDTILSNVPIVGYILTGKDKAFLSYFYEVKGSLEDPKIEAIPLKSLEEPFWGTLKRLLETPLRPFQKAPPP